MHGRVHGSPPYRRVVVHGGPGAPGSAQGLARMVGDCLEPFQAAASVDGQVTELAEMIADVASPPVVLIGHSWGAMLSLLTAASRPDLVEKVVLVCSGGFTADSYRLTRETRISRLSTEQAGRANELQTALRSMTGEEAATALEEYYGLFASADAYDTDPDALPDEATFEKETHEAVWGEAIALRDSGELIERVLRVKTPVVAIHGSYDPHPVSEVATPLSKLSSFKMVVIDKCGHEPWKERQAKAAFQEALAAEL